MKTYLSLFALFFAGMFAACNTPGSLSQSKYQDDVYYSSKDAVADKEKKRAAEDQARIEAEERANAEAKAKEEYYKKQAAAVDTTPFEYDDYYDYEYAARLKRFHNSCGTYSYYDNYYTNSYYYSGNPYNYGTSIYMGYSWWGPSYATYSYYPSYSWYSSYGWGYDPFYNPYGYYDPYYGYGGYYGYNPYNPYMNGYSQGYWNGYNQGYWNGYNQGYWNNYYFNSYDNNSYYYGPRKTTGSNSRTTSQPTLAHRYMDAVENETGKPFEDTKGRDNNPYALNTSVNDYMTKPASTGKPPVNTNTANPVYKPTNPVYQSSDDYTRPANNNSTSKPAQNNSGQKDNGTNKPANNNSFWNTDKPANNNNTYEQPKPTYDNKPNRTEPKFEAPKATPAPPPTPRSNNSSGNSSQPRKR